MSDDADKLAAAADMGRAEFKKRAGRIHGPLARAHRIEVDRCAACPFLRSVVDGLRYQCAHPAAPADVDELLPTSPPSWCPLRGAVTMIAGPSSLTKTTMEDPDASD